MNLDSEYDNRARVPNSSALINGWMRDAAVFRSNWDQADLAIPYGPTERQKLDIFWPNVARDVPIVMFIHGGNWQIPIDGSWFSHLAAGFVQNGVAFAVPSYDLCPNVTLGEIVVQIQRVGAFLARKIQRQFVCIGHSSGAHLAAMLMQSDWLLEGLPEDTIAGSLLISGIFDLRPVVSTKINDNLKLNMETARDLSPALLPRRAECHFHAVVGDEESQEFKRQTAAIEEAWGGTSEIIPGANHFSIIEPLVNPKSALVSRALCLMNTNQT